MRNKKASKIHAFIIRHCWPQLLSLSGLWFEFSLFRSVDCMMSLGRFCGEKGLGYTEIVDSTR